MSTALTQQTEFGPDQLQLIREKLAPKADDADLMLFGALCQRTGLDPFRNQIYLVPRWDSRLKKEVYRPQVSIDGLRLIAQRSGEIDGQDGPHWCGADGIWRDVWLSPERPAAAKVTVFRRGCRAGFTGVATLAEYMQSDREGKPSGLWGKMPAVMLAKCAESLAIRKAFPQELSGLYEPSELPETDPSEVVSVASPDTRQQASQPPMVADTQASFRAVTQESNRLLLADMVRQKISSLGMDLNAESTLKAVNRGVANPIQCIEDLGDLTTLELESLLGRLDRREKR